MSLKRLFIVAISILIISYIGIAYMLSNKVLVTNSSLQKTLDDVENYWGTNLEDMLALLPPPEDFEVEGDEALIKGKYFSVSDSAKCVFIFAHGWARSWPNMLKYYPMVDDCGCNIVMYDHRAHGESTGKFPTGGIKEANDLIAVTHWVSNVKNYDWNQIAWLGSSWGAGAALVAGAESENPAFIVGDATFQDWNSAVFERAIEDYGAGIKLIAPAVMQMVNLRAGIDYKEASARNKAKLIEEPVLLIHSEADPETNSQQSVNIFENLNEKSEFHHTQWGNIHVMDVINNTEEMKAILNNFIEKNEIEAFIPITKLDSIPVVEEL